MQGVGSVPGERDGACARCGSYAWVTATWVKGEGTVCGRCLPPRRRQRQRGENLGGFYSAVRAYPLKPSGLAVRCLTREEAEAAYPGRLSPRFGERPSPPAEDPPKLRMGLRPRFSILPRGERRG